MTQTQTTSRPAPAFNVAALFALNVKPVPAPVFGRAARALAEAEALGLDLLDLDLSDTVRNPWGFGPEARDTFTR